MCEDGNSVMYAVHAAHVFNAKIMTLVGRLDSGLVGVSSLVLALLKYTRPASPKLSSCFTLTMRCQQFKWVEAAQSAQTQLCINILPDAIAWTLTGILSKSPCHLQTLSKP
jgi:hypothetical protein